MPELPEVETVRRDLDPLLTGDTIVSVEVLRTKTVAYPGIQDFCQMLTGKQFTHWQRRGKYLLGSFTTGEHLAIHLRMTGQLLWVDPSLPLSSHTRIRFGLQSKQELRFDDQRTFGQLWAIPAGQDPTAVIRPLQSLGPEPFSQEFSSEYLTYRLQRIHRPIKSALLDQTLVAGLGNIYADETLFLSQIHPETPSHHLTLHQIQILHARIQAVLTSALEQRGSSIRSYRDALGINGNYQGIAWVYGRKGQQCRLCQTPIQVLRLSGRSSHFCPTCQSPRQ
jgi:formamidopyrimidine-DNA glycosylase